METVVKKLHMPEISRAIAKHDADAAYTILCENFSQGVAGRLLLELVRTQHDWPQVKYKKIDYHQVLTPREMEVLRCAEQGFGEKETAAKIYLGCSTVKSHRKHAILKLEVRNMVQAVHKGRELGLI